MKRIITLCLLIVNAHIVAEPTTGLITQTSTFGGANTYHTSKLYADTADYVNGGLTFTYPTDYWNFFGNISAPRVCVSVQKINDAPVTTEAYTAMIISNTDTSTTVLVYKIIDGGFVLEANSGEVLVTLYAIQDLSPFI